MFALKIEEHDYLALDQALNKMILEGRVLEAFEIFYDESVVMQENDNVPILGKDANRDREFEFMDGIIELRSSEVLSTGSGNDTTFSHWRHDFTHKDWGVSQYRQVAIRTWKHGRIIREVFHYG